MLVFSYPTLFIFPINALRRFSPPSTDSAVFITTGDTFINRTVAHSIARSKSVSKQAVAISSTVPSSRILRTTCACTHSSHFVVLQGKSSILTNSVYRRLKICQQRLDICRHYHRQIMPCFSPIANSLMYKSIHLLAFSGP